MDVTTFVLIPGAGGVAWYWHRIVPLVEEAGHDAIAVDLPGEDEQAGLPEYTRLVLDAISGRDDVWLVAQSMGAFTAALVAREVPLQGLVFVNAMIPAPGETASEWWGNTGSNEAAREAAESGDYSTDYDLFTYFLHDVPLDVAAEGEGQERDEAERLSARSATSPPGHPSRSGRWPVPTTASSRWPSSRSSHETGSESKLTSCPAAT